MLTQGPWEMPCMRPHEAPLGVVHTKGHAVLWDRSPVHCMHAGDRHDPWLLQAHASA